LAMYLRDDLRKRFTLAYLFARRAAELSQPNDGLFVDAEVYTWKAAAEAGICAYWANDRVSAVRYFEAIQAKVPAEKREWAAQTLAVCRRDAQPPQARP